LVVVWKETKVRSYQLANKSKYVVLLEVGFVQMLVASDATYWTLHNDFPFISFPFPSFAPTTFYLIP
jgi:hypothetical protein